MPRNHKKSRNITDYQFLSIQPFLASNHDKKLVLRAGLEPTTLCLEGRCSIQLSYQSTFKQAVFPRASGGAITSNMEVKPLRHTSSGGTIRPHRGSCPRKKPISASMFPRGGPFEVAGRTQFVIIYHVCLKNQCKESAFPVFSQALTGYNKSFI